MLLKFYHIKWSKTIEFPVILKKQVLLKTGLAPRRNPKQKLELEVFEFWKEKKPANSETAQLGNLQFLWQL